METERGRRAGTGAGVPMCPTPRLGVPVPAAGPGVCRTCHGPARDGRHDCWCCRAVGAALEPGGPTPPVVPVALYRPGDPLHAVLRRYKDAPATAARRYFGGVVVALLDGFLATHGACLRSAVEDGWDAVCVVPSARRATASSGPAGSAVAHPFEAVVGRIAALAAYPRIRLVCHRLTVDHLVPDAGASAVDADVRGRRVLLLDDTWTTGAHARSAAAALRGAGAGVAAVVVAGRVVDPTAAPGIGTWWTSVVARAPGTVRGSPCCLEGCRLALRDQAP